MRLTAPAHPILVHFTMALTLTAFAFDLAVRVSGFRALHSAGWWLLAADILITTLTVGTGVKARLDWPVEEGEARSFLRAHMALGPGVLGGLFAVGIWRALWWQAGVAVGGWYLAALAAVIVAMAVQGYLGGEMVYRFGAGVRLRRHGGLAAHARRG